MINVRILNYLCSWSKTTVNSIKYTEQIILVQFKLELQNESYLVIANINQLYKILNKKYIIIEPCRLKRPTIRFVSAVLYNKFWWDLSYTVNCDVVREGHCRSIVKVLKKNVERYRKYSLFFQECHPFQVPKETNYNISRVFFVHSFFWGVKQPLQITLSVHSLVHAADTTAISLCANPIGLWTVGLLRIPKKMRRGMRRRLRRR